MALPKSYETVARFGATSTTGDPEGEIVETGVVPEGDLTLPTGAIRQRPPAYSAVKVGGERAYKRARRGEEVELPEREVTVYAFDELARDGDAAHVRDPLLVRHVRALARSPTSATPTASSCGAPRSGRSTSPTPTPSGSCR